MAENVVPLFAAPDPEPYVTGTARCMACQHEWIASAPVGVLEFECPDCRRTYGSWFRPTHPADGTIWECTCGNCHFLLTPTGAPMCARCGLRATTWAEG